MHILNQEGLKLLCQLDHEGVMALKEALSCFKSDQCLSEGYLRSRLRKKQSWQYLERASSLMDDAIYKLNAKYFEWNE